jgi:general secretion pathway protein M
MMRWMTTKTWNRSRAAALGLLLMAMSLPVLALAVPWIAAYHDLAQQLSATRDSLQRYQDVAAQLPALQSQLQALRHDHGQSGYWASGSALVDTVKAMVEQRGATLTSAQDKPTIAQEGIPQQTVRLSLVARADQLTTLLYDIETHEPALFMEDISITNRYAFSQYGSKSTTSDAGALQVMLEVSGFQAKTP